MNKTPTLADFVTRNAAKTKKIRDPPKRIQKQTILQLRSRWGGLSSALEIKSAKNKDYIVDQIGVVWTLLNVPEVFMDVSDKIVHLKPDGDERGLLSIAFHPRFGIENSKVYACYSSDKPKINTSIYGREPSEMKGEVRYYNLISEFSRLNRDGSVDTSSEKVLMAIEKKSDVHNGGRLCFGPDGFLYISLGDGGPFFQGSKSETLVRRSKVGAELIRYGKVLRIDVDHQKDGVPYSIPDDNPFSKGQDGQAPEIFAVGFRSPWSICFDPLGRLVVADVGLRSWEKVTLVYRGSNCGWPFYEGNHPTPWSDPHKNPMLKFKGVRFTDAVYEYKTMKEPSAIIGGVAYKDEDSGLIRYLCGDINGTLMLLEEQENKVWVKIAETRLPKGLLIKSINSDTKGRIYALASKNVGPGGNTGCVVEIEAE